MVKIKFCGLRREEDIDYVNDLKPDYIGFILSGGFRRSIDYSTAQSLVKRLDKSIKAVGVFVDDSIDYINSFIKNGIIDMVQLHGSESPPYCEKINAPVIKYFSPDNFSEIDKYAVQYILLDSGTGTGKTFDWGKIPQTDKKIFLAGGIDRDNIQKAVKTVNPYCIDLSSAVETNGVKDYNKMKEIMESVKNE